MKTRSLNIGRSIAAASLMNVQMARVPIYLRKKDPDYIGPNHASNLHRLARNRWRSANTHRGKRSKR